MITLNIPTSLQEAKRMWKEKTDKRYQHNQKVVQELYCQIVKRMNSNYWTNDISRDFRARFFDEVGFNTCGGLLNKALKDLQ